MFAVRSGSVPGVGSELLVTMFWQERRNYFSLHVSLTTHFFVYCPQDTLVMLAKKLKKNNVAVDVVAFGLESENSEKVEAFHAAVNSNDNSHLVTVPAGTVISDMLYNTPIFSADGEMPFGGMPAGAGADGVDYAELGVDPNMDPELALALRVSMEEERARQAAQLQAAGEAGPSTQPEGAGIQEASAHDGVQNMDEDALLMQALALSMQVWPCLPGGGLRLDLLSLLTPHLVPYINRFYFRAGQRQRSCRTVRHRRRCHGGRGGPRARPGTADVNGGRGRKCCSRAGRQGCQPGKNLPAWSACRSNRSIKARNHDFHEQFY